MAHFLFVDESGYDAGESPYGVLAGISVEDRDLWSLVKDIRVAERTQFGGVQYSGGERELKAKKLLKRKVFRQAAALVPFPPEQKALFARECLEQGERAGGLRHGVDGSLCALPLQSLCQHREHDITGANARPLTQGLCVFVRAFLLLPRRLCSMNLRKSRGHLLVEQMDRYFKLTARGRQRSSQILPEPLFVHSDLTTGVQLADLVAYTISWEFGSREWTVPARVETEGNGQRVTMLRHRSIREVTPPNFVVWSLAYIRDLRSRKERDTDTIEELLPEGEAAGKTKKGNAA